jgi:DHA2 family multidrug resistance protein
MIVVGRLLKIVEARWLILTGLLITAATLSVMVGFTDNTTARSIVITSVFQGVGLGLVFVPLSTVAFASLPGHLRTDGASILTLLRNIGSSIGISVVIANLTSGTTRMHAYLSEYVTPFNDALKMPDVAAVLNMTTDAGRAMMDAIVSQQAVIIAYANDYKLLMWLTLAAVPLVLIIRSVRVKPSADEPMHAMD